MSNSTRVLAALFVMSATASAQVAPSVSVGVRIRASDGLAWRGTGTVLEVRGDSIVVKVDATGAPLALRRTEIGALEIRDGGRRNTLKGLAIGLVAGGGTGALIGLASGDDKCSTDPNNWFPCMFVYSAGDKAAMLGIFLGAVGGSVGALSGFLTKTDHWVPARVNAVAVSPIMGRDGQFGVSLRF